MSAGVGGKHPDHTALGQEALQEHPRPLQWSFQKENVRALGYPDLTTGSAMILLSDKSLSLSET